MKILRNRVYMGLVLSLFISMGAGCAATHKTTTTETTVQYPNREDSKVEQRSTEVASDQPNPPVVESTTTTTSTETKPQEMGIVGGLFQIIGSVIAFPFIVIGGLLRMIF